MAALATGELLLLRTITPIILEVVIFFTGDDQRAQDARRRIAAKVTSSEPSYAALYTDLKDLDSTLQILPDTLTSVPQEDLDSISDVLQIIEERVLVDTADDRDFHEYVEPDRYPGICFLLDSLTTSDWGPAPEERVTWLIGKTKLERPRKQTRDDLVAALGLCTAALRQYGKVGVADTSWAPQSGQAEFDGARSVYAEAERLHGALLKSWICRCHVRHENTRFAFDLSACSTPGALGCTFFFPSKSCWQPARLHFKSKDGNDNIRVLTTDVPIDRMRSSRQCSNFEARRQSHICDLLKTMSAGGCISLDDSAVRLARDDGDFDVELFGFPHCDNALRSWSDLINGHELPHSKLKHRLTLALILSYAYLHLGGGPWWPYHRGEDNVHLCLTPDVDGRLMKLPFFTPSLLQAPEGLQAPKVLKMFNRYMPSLPAFGKLLFELARGRHVDWQHIEKEMKDFEDEPHASDILAAVKACTGLDENDIFTSGGNIRDDERLRMHFVKNVVLRVQHVLDVAFGLKVQDIFGTPNVEIPSISNRDRRVNLRAPPPSSIVPAGFCLHDGGDTVELHSKEAEAAEQYMVDLSSFIDSTFRQGLAADPPSDTTPIRIAVLDTGAAISRAYVSGVYDDRFVECRSWLDTSEDSGRVLFNIDHPELDDQDAQDHDGHGTHATSVLLDATTGSDIEVYVAQVFHSREGKFPARDDGEERTAHAIAQAIRHAVDDWNVDIISMSFGFPDVDSEVEAAIDYAYEHKKLMLAAASNCGGNGRLSWPARYEHVMCVHAATGQGNKYERNPSPLKREDNFAVLGCSVKACWLPDAKGVTQFAHKTGTSTATPIAAGIAGMVMTIMRRSRAAYLKGRDSRSSRAAELRYDQALTKLGRPSGMGRAFGLMIDPREDSRDGYMFLSPLRMLPRDSSDDFLLDRLLQVVQT